MYKIFEAKSSRTSSDPTIYRLSITTDNIDKFNTLKQAVQQANGAGQVNIATYEHDDKYDPIFKAVITTESEDKFRQIEAIAYDIRGDNT